MAHNRCAICRDLLRMSRCRGRARTGACLGGLVDTPPPPPSPVRRQSRWPGRRTRADTTGQDNPGPTRLVMVRPPSATAAPRRVPKPTGDPRPRGTCGIDSGNEDRAHPDCRHRHRVVPHQRDGTGNATSRGPVSTHPFTDIDTDRHDGTNAAVSTVDTCTTRQPSGRARPDRPPHRPAPPTTSYRRARP